jgi:hypothetical protein
LRTKGHGVCFCVLTVSDYHFEINAADGRISGGCGVTDMKAGHKKQSGNIYSITVLACSVLYIKILSVVYELLILHAD